MIVYLNNAFVEDKKASIPIDDRGFLLGDAVFETVKVHSGTPLHLDLHFKRLKDDCDVLDLTLIISFDELSKIITELLLINNINENDASLRITITRGGGARGLLPPDEINPTILICVFNFNYINTDKKLVSSPYLRSDSSPIAKIKSAAYTENIINKKFAFKRGFDDALILNTNKKVCCVSAANIFIIKNSEFRLLSHDFNNVI